MAKQRLLTSGPTEVPEAALLAMARQVTHRRAAVGVTVHGDRPDFCGVGR